MVSLTLKPDKINGERSQLNLIDEIIEITEIKFEEMRFRKNLQTEWHFVILKTLHENLLQRRNVLMCGSIDTRPLYTMDPFDSETIRLDFPDERKPIEINTFQSDKPELDKEFHSLLELEDVLSLFSAPDDRAPIREKLGEKMPAEITVSNNPNNGNSSPPFLKGLKKLKRSFIRSDIKSGRKDQDDVPDSSLSNLHDIHGNDKDLLGKKTPWSLAVLKNISFRKRASLGTTDL